MSISEYKLAELIQLQELGYDTSEISVELKERIENQTITIPCIESEILGYLENDYLAKLIYKKLLENDRLSPSKAEYLVKLEIAKKFKTHTTRIHKYLEFVARKISIFCKQHHWKYITESQIELMLENIASSIARHKAIKNL